MTFGLVGTATPVVTLCEKREVLPKDKDGNVDWMAAVQRIPQPDFWDDIATNAGDQVCAELQILFTYVWRKRFDMKMLCSLKSLIVAPSFEKNLCRSKERSTPVSPRPSPMDLFQDSALVML